MSKVKAKKYLGQHFLNDPRIAQDIVDSLSGNGYNNVLEIGAGMGILTKPLLDKKEFDVQVIDIDHESIQYLKDNYPSSANRIHFGDFLKLDLNDMFKTDSLAIIGNFPYNISSQILFKVLDHIDKIPELVGMFQKEVAERVSAKHGNKTYGLTSVLLQVYYDIEYLFTVHENVFSPPPKVKSAVIRLCRKNTAIDCDPILFKKVVKTAFHQRRKMLRNSLAIFKIEMNENESVWKLRPEQLSPTDFITLTQLIKSKLEKQSLANN